MRWTTSPGLSTSVCGIMGSLSGSVYSWMSRSFWMVRPGSERKVHWAPTDARNSCSVWCSSVEILDIQEYTDPDNDPMIPHTLVLKPGLVVHSVYNGYWFWGRPSIGDLWHDLRAVVRETRPDWDLSTRGLREAWDAGDLSPF